MWLSSLRFPLPSNQTRLSIPDGVAGTAATIHHMQDLVSQGKRDGRIRALAVKIVRSCGSKNYHCYGQAIHDWVHDNILYVHDAPGIETIVSPYRVLFEIKGGDCDDQCVAVAALAESIGIPARYVTIKADSAQPDEYSHIFSQLQIPGHGWVTSDTTMDHGFGWTPPEKYESKVWPASKDAPVMLENDGMNGLGRCCAACTSGVAGIFGLSGLGASDSVLDIIQKVADGTYAREIKERDAELTRQTVELSKLSASVGKMPVSFKQNELLAIIRKGREKIAAEREKVIQARGKHNFIVSELNRFGFNLGLAGLGALVIPPAVIASAAVAAAALALSALVWSFRADPGAKGYIEQVSDGIRATGGVVEQTGTASVKLGVVALVGVALFFGIKMLAKKGAF